MLLLFISLVIGRFSLLTEGDPCLLFRLTAVIPPLGRRFSVHFLVLIFYELFTRVWYLFWYCLGALFSPSFGYGLAVFSSLQPAWWVVLSVGTGGLYLHSFCFLISHLFPLVVLTLLESYYRSRIWFIHKPQTLTPMHT